jgi:hypothetical protein
MGAITAEFGSGEYDLKAELGANLLAHVLQHLAEEFFHAATAQTNHVRVFLFEARLVIMFFTLKVSQVELVDQAALLEKLQRSVDGHAVQLRVALFSHLAEAVGIQVEPGTIDQFQ